MATFVGSSKATATGREGHVDAGCEAEGRGKGRRWDDGMKPAASGASGEKSKLAGVLRIVNFICFLFIS